MAQLLGNTKENDYDPLFNQLYRFGELGGNIAIKLKEVGKTGKASQGSAFENPTIYNSDGTISQNQEASGLFWFLLLAVGALALG